jgi:hypothetical protein
MPQNEQVIPEKILHITVAFADETDLDFMRIKLVGAIEEWMDESSSKLDGDWDVDWEIEEYVGT